MRLDRVRKNLIDELDIIIDTKPYILYPHIPIGGSPKSEFAKKTKSGMGRSLKHEAAIENIEIKYKLIDRIPNSMEAHRVMSLISDLNVKYNVSKDIFHAYFQEGKNIEDAEVLKNILIKNKIDQKIINLFEQPEEGLDIVKKDLQWADDHHIALVPTIELSSALNILGLQAADVWENYFRRVAKFVN